MPIPLYKPMIYLIKYATETETNTGINTSKYRLHVCVPIPVSSVASNQPLRLSTEENTYTLGINFFSNESPLPPPCNKDFIYSNFELDNIVFNTPFENIEVITYFNDNSFGGPLSAIKGKSKMNFADADDFDWYI